MPKVWTEEERKAFGEKMKKLKEAKKSEQATNKPEVSSTEQVLDLTAKNFNSEAEFVRFIHWEYDDGRLPTLVKVTSHQALVIAGFTKVVPVKGYNSPFGTHRIQIVTQKEISDAETQE